MKNVVKYLIIIVAVVYSLSQVKASEPTGYLSVTGPCNLEFPQAHGAHPGYRTEWWYYTGNLQDVSGEHFGFQLTFFRSQIRPLGDRRKWPRPTSAWRTSQIYLAHSAITSISGKKHRQAELVSREVLNLAGARTAGETTTLFINNWTARINPERLLLKVHTDGFGSEMV